MSGWVEAVNKAKNTTIHSVRLPVDANTLVAHLPRQFFLFNSPSGEDLTGHGVLPSVLCHGVARLSAGGGALVWSSTTPRENDIERTGNRVLLHL